MIDERKEQELYIKKVRNRKTTIIITRLIILIAIFVLWEVAGNLGWIDPFFN